MFDQNQTPNQPQPPSNLPFGQPQNPFMPPPPAPMQAQPQPQPAAFQPQQPAQAAPPQSSQPFSAPTAQPFAAAPVEDMFASDQPASGPSGQYRPAAMPQYQRGPQITEADLFGGAGLPWGKIITFAIIGVVVVGGAGAAIWGYSYFSGRTQAPPAATPQVTPPAVTPQTPTTEAPPAATPPATTSPDTPSAEATRDSDGDGLVDSEEKTAGTDVNRADTDADGLTDWAEVKIYRTQPLIADTDGDSYADGAEVVNGFDPLIAGSARLYDVPKATSTQ